jgi:hypothetical protein
MMIRLRSSSPGSILLLALLWLSAAVWAQDDDDGRPELSERELRQMIVGMKVNANDRNPLIRAAAARDLPTLQCVETMKIGHELLGDSEAYVRNAAFTAIASFDDEESLRWLAHDGLRRGNLGQRCRVILAMGLIRHPELVEDVLFEQLDHPEPRVKAAAITALADQAIRKALPPILALAGHSDEEVREAVAVAIGYLGDITCMEAMRALIKDESWTVRSAVINAAARLKIKPVVSMLIERLPEEEGRLRKDLRDSLVKLTGEDFGMDPDLWASWWNANKADYGVTEKIEMVVHKDDYATWTEYCGIKIYSTRVLFLVDISESMGKPVASTKNNKVTRMGKEGTKGRKYTATTKLGVVQEELTYVIKDLADNVYFNILTYSTEVEKWKPGPVKASHANKKNALRFIKRLRPTPNGATNIHGVLMEALGATGKSTAAAAKVRDKVDTIFLLADGEPTYGILTDPLDINREVKFANPDARIVIHAIQFGDLGNVDFMRDLAEGNGGELVVIQ